MQVKMGDLVIDNPLKLFKMSLYFIGILNLTVIMEENIGNGKQLTALGCFLFPCWGPDRPTLEVFEVVH